MTNIPKNIKKWATENVFALLEEIWKSETVFKNVTLRKRAEKYSLVWGEAPFFYIAEDPDLIDAVCRTYLQFKGITISPSASPSTSPSTSPSESPSMSPSHSDSPSVSASPSDPPDPDVPEN
jgi:hypothetical protein